ncbi:hypothetical protein GGR56DRAFT_457452 [Xylariaceae sp. FL0804]|nr:hypothetical protein GGR56DRAFT_457452 [Xylariaceae sp. FL0804]
MYLVPPLSTSQLCLIAWVFLSFFIIFSILFWPGLAWHRMDPSPYLKVKRLCPASLRLSQPSAGVVVARTTTPTIRPAVPFASAIASVFAVRWLIAGLLPELGIHLFFSRRSLLTLGSAGLAIIRGGPLLFPYLVIPAGPDRVSVCRSNTGRQSISES